MMYSIRQLIIAIAMLLTISCSYGQDERFTGSYMNTTGNLSLHLVLKKGQYFGVVQAVGAAVILTATQNNNALKGEIYVDNTTKPFIAKLTNGILEFTYENSTEQHWLLKIMD